MPANESLTELSGPSSPLLKLVPAAAAATPAPTKAPIKLAFYGDSITWVNRFQPVLERALAEGAGTKGLAVTLLNQGINGGTARDLEERGYSPWGHLDPSKKQSNISFAETLERDQPHVVGVQIGINDFMQVDSFASNASAYGRVLDRIVATVRQSAPAAKLYLVTVSVDGEEVDNKNHQALSAYADAMKAAGTRQQPPVPVVDLLGKNLAYERQNNCLNLHGGVLTGAGVHPYTPQGAVLLANAHAEGVLAALAGV
eukprot:g1424.t1